MSMLFKPLPPNCIPELRRDVWSRLFGGYMRTIRQKTGRSVEETAALAGLTTLQWSNLEAGNWLPETTQQLQAMAEALNIDWSGMAELVYFCGDAWGFFD